MEIGKDNRPRQLARISERHRVPAVPEVATEQAGSRKYMVFAEAEMRGSSPDASLVVPTLNFRQGIEERLGAEIERLKSPNQLVGVARDPLSALSLNKRTEISVAFVGWTANSSDFYHLTEVNLALHLEGAPTRAQVDTISLEGGRDFLKESKTYDVVIILHILNRLGDDQVGGDQTFRTGAAAVSAIQSPDTWRDRLVRTNARVIFAFGAPEGEVGGNYLGEISGYTKSTMRTSSSTSQWSLPYTVYVNNLAADSRGDRTLG